MKVKAFDPAYTALLPGVNLLEASAGTGKTYTIAMLVLRFVVELDIPVDKILVVTFTKAATEELKTRIRNRLSEVKRILANREGFPDDPITRWLDQTGLPPKIIKQRLDLALLDIDQAGIYTIHGFCQRMLIEHALSSGQLFDAELTEDLGAIKQACADDFWRQHIQSRPAWEIGVLTSRFPTPDALLKSITLVPEETEILPETKNLELTLSQLKQCANHAKHTISAIKDILKTQFQGSQFKTSYQDTFNGHIDLMESWLHSESAHFPGHELFGLLTTEGLINGLNGNQFRGNQRQSAEERKVDYLRSLNLDTKVFDELAAKSQEIPTILRKNLLERVRSALNKQLEQLNLWSFDNLISHLANALKREHARHLTGELRQRYQAALIDEFQDTDSQQWHIFSALFAVDSHYLILVGDPKQAIYKFRGADIYAYLEAQSQAQFHYTLENNWRSHPQLVEAVNQLFGREHAFLLPDITFHPALPALTAAQGALYESGAPCAPMMLWQLPASGNKSGYWQPNRNDAATAIRKAVVDEICDLLNGSYTLQPHNRRLMPQDIAILVRSNQQAQSYQDQLREAGVPSVLNSVESVFSSDECANLLVFLQAVAHPGDMSLLAAALALDWFGYDGQALYKLLNDEAALDTFSSRFAEYHALWQKSGVMAMMQRVLTRESVVEALAKSRLAERRLTNLQHSLELLQQAAAEERLGLHKTIHWLQSEIVAAQSKPGAAGQRQIRLESDADTVKIVTMHRAKGLEYPVVFCPFLWQSNHREDSKNPFVQCHAVSHDGHRSRLIADLGSENLAHHAAQAKSEEFAEDIRLAYVALTRAKYRCYVAWANVRTEEKPNESALAWLLGLSGQDFQSQQEILQSLAILDEKAFSYRLLEISSTAESPKYSENTQNPAVPLSAKARTRALHSEWQMSSYTALSALSLQDTPELPDDKSGETYELGNSADVAIPAGAHAGNVLHDLLENMPFRHLGNKTNISEIRNKACRRYGLQLTQPDAIDALLGNVVATPLSATDTYFCLMNLHDAQCLKEMPFYLSMAPLNTRDINGILRSQPAFQPLSYKQMSGFLTGFIDLICEYGGRFYVMDYKSNLLPDYRNETLLNAMREHNYGLQYWIYSVVLHRYLQKRLPGYHFSQHFGGVRYLFMRGMNPSIPMSGVFEAMPEQTIIEALAGVFEI